MCYKAPSPLVCIQTGLVLYFSYITLSHLCHQNHLLRQLASYSVALLFLLHNLHASLVWVRA
jgi:hypothetical protein